MFGISCFAQNYTEKTLKIDTLKLGTFNEKNVMGYEIENAIIYISAKKYLTGLIDSHNTYKDLMKDIDENDESYKDYKQSYKFIDSIKIAVENGIKKNDTIRLSNKLFEKETLNGLADFRTYINKSDCAIFDLNGIRQYIIIRKTILETDKNRNDYASEWSVFYLLKEFDPFLRALNWIT
jgi:hypothetical protein